MKKQLRFDPQELEPMMQADIEAALFKPTEKPIVHDRNYQIRLAIGDEIHEMQLLEYLLFLDRAGFTDDEGHPIRPMCVTAAATEGA